MTTATATAATAVTAAPKPTKAQVEADQAKNLAAARKEHGSTSGAIRALAAKGMSMGDISRFLGRRFQHVRNVLITPVKNPKAAPATK